MKIIATLFVILAFASSASASLALRECPVAPIIPGADIGKIAGRWNAAFAGFQQALTHNTMDFTPREDGDFNLTISTTLPDGSKACEYALARRNNFQNSLILYYDWSKKVPYRIKLYVTTSHYDNYLPAYICHVFPGRSFITGYLNLFRADTTNAEMWN